MPLPVSPEPIKNPHMEAFKSEFKQSLRDAPRQFFGELIVMSLFALYWVAVIGLPGALGFWLFGWIGSGIGVIFGLIFGITLFVILASSSIVKGVKNWKSSRVK